jgi:hypothetical protein
MTDVVTTLREELTNLERRIAELKALERRAAKIRDLLTEYGQTAPPQKAIVPPGIRRPPMVRRVPVPAPVAPPPQREGIGAKPGSMAQRIVDGAIAYLRHKGSAAKTPEIVVALAKVGVLPPGTAKDEYGVSSRLSRSPLFTNDGRDGYSLAEWNPAEKEPNA